MNQCSQAPDYFTGDIHEWMFVAGVNNTSIKLFTSVNDTCDKFIAGVNNIGD